MKITEGDYVTLKPSAMIYNHLKGKILKVDCIDYNNYFLPVLKVSYEDLKLHLLFEDVDLTREYKFLTKLKQLKDD